MISRKYLISRGLRNGKRGWTMELPRKSVQEVEIDHLLAEEFACDQLFAQRFLVGCGLGSLDFATTSVIVEPSFGGVAKVLETY